MKREGIHNCNSSPLRLSKYVVFCVHNIQRAYLLFQEKKTFVLNCIALDRARDTINHAETTVTVLTLKCVARLAKESEDAWTRHQRCQTVGWSFTDKKKRKKRKKGRKNYSVSMYIQMHKDTIKEILWLLAGNKLQQRRQDLNWENTVKSSRVTCSQHHKIFRWWWKHNFLSFPSLYDPE